jgi:hypothetical protein
LAKTNVFGKKEVYHLSILSQNLKKKIKPVKTYLHNHYV